MINAETWESFNFNYMHNNYKIKILKIASNGTLFLINRDAGEMESEK
jgi:hypothetical protein